jgi:hypothetical protein
MRKRLPVLVGVLFVLVAGAGLVTVWFRSCFLSNSINLENFAKIQPGMSESDVEAILGGPAGNYSSGNYSSGWVKTKSPLRVWTGWPPPVEKAWITDEGCIVVLFDESGKVMSAQFWEPIVLEESLLEKVRRWLGL